MASSDNLVTIEQQPWRFGKGMTDGWISDFFTKETETLTKALTKSFTNSDCTSTEMIEPLLLKTEATSSQTPTPSGCSENEVPFSKRRKVGVTGKITKRKSRAKKRATTTFITADPANFRQMVQQVTGGVRFDSELNGLIPVSPVLQPHSQRPISMFQTGFTLPTLDTSSFLLDQQVVQPPVTNVSQPPAVVSDGGGAGFSFDSFCSFPTLESWKVM